MRIPKGLKEDDFVKLVNNVIATVAGNYIFGYYDLDDIKQQAWVEILKPDEKGRNVLDKYDDSLPLENFLCVHIKNRLTNLIRNKYHRNDPPCKICHGEINGNTAHKDRKYCQKYSAWLHRNTDKAHIVCPIDIGNIDDTEEKNTRKEDTTVSSIAKNEIFDLIDIKLPATMRADYLKMKAGVSIPKKRKEQIIKEIQGFLTGDEFADIINED